MNCILFPQFGAGDVIAIFAFFLAATKWICDIIVDRKRNRIYIHIAERSNPHGAFKYALTLATISDVPFVIKGIDSPQLGIPFGSGFILNKGKPKVIWNITDNDEIFSKRLLNDVEVDIYVHTITRKDPYHLTYIFRKIEGNGADFAKNL